MEADEMANMKLLGEIYRKYVETCYKSEQWILMTCCYVPTSF